MRILSWLLTLILIFLIAAFLRFIPVPQGRQPNNDITALKLSRGKILTQSFTDSKEYLEGIGLVFVKPGDVVGDGKLTVDVWAARRGDFRGFSFSSRRRLAALKVPVSKLQPDRETTFRFPRKRIYSDEILLLSLRATSPPHNAAACLVSKQQNVKDSHLFINGKRSNLSLVLQTYHPESAAEIFGRMLRKKAKFRPLLDARVLPPLLILLFFFAAFWAKKFSDLGAPEEPDLEMDFYSR